MFVRLLVIGLGLVVTAALSSSASATPISGSVIWLDASDLNGDGNMFNNPASGTPVSMWADKGAAQGAQNAVQANPTFQPTYIADVQNGLGAVRFSGGQILAMPNVTVGPMTAFVAFRAASSSLGVFLEHGANSNTDDGMYWVSTTGATMNYRRGVRSAKDVTPSTWSQRPELLTATMTYGGSHASHLMFIDGSPATLNTASSHNNDAPTTEVTRALYLGARFGSGTPTLAFTGDIGELIVYNEVLNSAQRNIVQNYIAAKYDAPLTAGNFYAGAESAKGDYDFDVFGIGMEADGGLTVGTYGSGLTLEALNGLDPGQYVLAGHKTHVNALVGTDLAGSGAALRWERDWYIDTTGGVDVSLQFDLIAGDAAFPDGGEFMLLYRASHTGSFVDLGLAAVVAGDTVTFTVPGLIDGYYTLALSPIIPEPSTLVLLGMGGAGLALARRRRSR